MFGRQSVNRNTETVKLDTGRRGNVVWKEIYTHYQNDSCIKMSSDESHLMFH